MNTLKSVYENICKKLETYGITDFSSEADYIMSKILNINKMDYYLYPENKVSYKNVRKINEILHKRFLRQPLAYIFNEIEFYGLKFKINNKVLIPRQETEIIVEYAIKEIKKNGYKFCADIGVGSGNIAISITKFTDIEKMFAVDIDKDILKLAKYNAKNLDVGKKIKFLYSDGLKYFVEKKVKLDLIVSNPPYVTEEEYTNLQPEIYFEPISSLLSNQGLEVYKKIAEELKFVLKSGGKLILEINPNLVKRIKEIFFNKSFYNIKYIKGYNNSLIGLEIKH